MSAIAKRTASGPPCEPGEAAQPAGDLGRALERSGAARSASGRHQIS